MDIDGEHMLDLRTINDEMGFGGFYHTRCDVRDMLARYSPYHAPNALLRRTGVIQRGFSLGSPAGSKQRMQINPYIVNCPTPCPITSYHFLSMSVDRGILPEC